MSSTDLSDNDFENYDNLLKKFFFDFVIIRNNFLFPYYRWGSRNVKTGNRLILPQRYPDSSLTFPEGLFPNGQFPEWTFPRTNIFPKCLLLLINFRGTKVTDIN